VIQELTRPFHSILPQIDTPSLVVDAAVLKRNLETMSQVACDAGLSLRPHEKTHKSIAIATRQIELGAVGITVAKPQEALVMWRGGIRPVFLAYPPVGEHKLATLQPMIANGALIVGLDDVQVARPLGEMAVALGVDLPVMVEVDVGMRRVGLPWGADSAARACEIAAVPGIELMGIFCHEGHGHDVLPDQMPGFAREVAAHMSQTAELIRKQGHPCRHVSVGSTLTARHMRATQGITEMRPGTYVYNDLRTVRSGQADLSDCAVTILATVVSRPTPNRAVIDAGSKIFTPTYDEEFQYGLVLDVPGARLVRLSEEHGIIDLPGSSVALQIGDRVRVIPVHVCPTVNMQREMYEVSHGQVIGIIQVDAALCSR